MQPRTLRWLLVLPLLCLTRESRAGDEGLAPSTRIGREKPRGTIRSAGRDLAAGSARAPGAVQSRAADVADRGGHPPRDRHHGYSDRGGASRRRGFDPRQPPDARRRLACGHGRAAGPRGDRLAVRLAEPGCHARLRPRRSYVHALGHRQGPVSAARVVAGQRQADLPAGGGRHSAGRRGRSGADDQGRRTPRPGGRCDLRPARRPGLADRPSGLPRGRHVGQRGPVPSHAAGQAIARGDALAGRRSDRRRGTRDHGRPHHCEPQG